MAVCVLAVPSSAAAAPAAGADRELDAVLQDLARAQRTGGPVRALAEQRRVPITPGGRLRVEAYVDGDLAAAARGLAAAGLDVRAQAEGPALGVVEGWAGAGVLRGLTTVPGVTAVMPVAEPLADAGAVLSEGDAAHRGPAVRAGGVTGAGVKVGVISDSIDQAGGGVAASRASGDLPSGDGTSVDVITDDADGVDEGRAMAEIVFDTAPGVTQMAFASGTAGGAAEKAASIDALTAAGARIIADDIAFLSEPFFQDGVISQAVDRARDAGVAYFASAGNRARQSWEDTPRFGADALHDFDAGPATDTIQTLMTIPPGSTADPSEFAIHLQWDEPWNGAQHDLDLEVVNPTTGTVFFAASTDNLGTRIPREIASGRYTGSTPVTVGVRIRRFASAAGAPALTRLKTLVSTNFGGFTVAEHGSASAINPDAASARGAMAVAAVRHNEDGLAGSPFTLEPESFSSRGPVVRLFDAAGARLPAAESRAKPDVAGADGVRTTVAGFDPFFGTSAATPSVAGVAALVLSAKPALPLSLLRAIVTNPANALDCSAPGVPDLDCGSGFVLADRAVAQAQDATPPAVTPALSPAAPTGEDGWWTSDVSVTWGVADAGSPTEAVDDCAPAALTTDGERTSGCTARSAGGTTTAPAVTLRRDTTPPAVPVISGIAPGDFDPGAVPASATCTSSDATSGLASCVVGAIDASPGAHTVTATATDHAGLTSTASVAYTVGGPPEPEPDPDPDPAPDAGAPGPAPPEPPAAVLVPATGPLTPPAPAPAPVPAPVPTPAASATPERVASLVRLASSRRCVRARSRPSLRIRASTSSRVRRVVVRVTGRKRAIVRRKPGRITLPRVTRKRVKVQVTVTLANGRKATVKRTYRRC